MNKIGNTYNYDATVNGLIGAILGDGGIGVICPSCIIICPFCPAPPPPVPPIDSATVHYLEGQKQYELDNHLGNVLVTVSDRKIPIDTTSTSNIAQYYMPLIINAK